MKSILWIPAVAVAVLLVHAPGTSAQQPESQAVQTETPVAKSAETTEAQQTNINAYVELLRSDVKTKKVAILTELMNFNDEQAAKFWPIYREYDLELQALNDKKLNGIRDYANNYDKMTDEKANELAKLALALEDQRNDLKKKYYEKVREQLGGILAARFLQVENQMLMIVDLQIASSLPIVEK